MGVFDNARRLITKQIDDLKRQAFDKTFKKKIGAQVKDIIYKRVKSGFGVDDEDAPLPRKKRLAPLKESTKKTRKNLVKKGFGTGEGFGTGRSNLTLSGQLLDSIKVNPSNDLELTLDDGRNDGTTNTKVHGYAKDGSPDREARPFFAVTVDEQNIIEELCRDQLEKVAGKIFS